MENGKNLNSVSVECGLHTHGLNENPNFLDIPAGFEVVSTPMDDDFNFNLHYCTLYRKFPSIEDCNCCRLCTPESMHVVYLKEVDHE